jgi:transcriptional regulator with XRE-family HTH domain
MTRKQAEFSSRLRTLRLENKMTPEECAKDLDIHRSTIVRYEKGDRFPNFQGLIKIAERFSVTTDFLLGLSDRRKPQSTDEGALLSLSRYQLKEGSLIEQAGRSILEFDKASDLLLVQIEGTDYLPVYSKGDLLVFKRDLTPKNGNIILWKRNNKMDLRTFYKRNTGIILVGIAPYAPPEWISDWHPADSAGTLTHVIHRQINP